MTALVLGLCFVPTKCLSRGSIQSHSSGRYLCRASTLKLGRSYSPVQPASANARISSLTLQDVPKDSNPREVEPYQRHSDLRWRLQHHQRVGDRSRLPRPPSILSQPPPTSSELSRKMPTSRCPHKSDIRSPPPTARRSFRARLVRRVSNLRRSPVPEPDDIAGQSDAGRGVLRSGAGRSTIIAHQHYRIGDAG